MFEDYEGFTEAQIKILEQYVSNTSSNVFVLYNLPEVIKGALFSRYSRSSLGLRSLLLKEFVANEDLAFDQIVGTQTSTKEQIQGIKKAQNFYDRILDGYGDDSIAELGGAHLAIENISMLGAKIIEDSRIGGSPLEKSTRYIYFDQKINNEFAFYREPILMTSAYRDLYIKTCNMLFETYSSLIPPLTELMEQRYPKTEETSKAAYISSIRAKVLDCIRGLLPTSTLTNMGVYGNGRFFDYLMYKLHSNSLIELQDISRQSYEELSKIIPSFVKRADVNHRHYQSYARFHEGTQDALKQIAANIPAVNQTAEAFSTPAHIRLIDYNPRAVQKVAGALLYPYCNYSLSDLETHCSHLSEEELAPIFESATAFRENRRHKSPRALENAEFTFEITADFGVYRDLQRHRILTQDRQLLTCDYGYYTPSEIFDTKMEALYHKAMEEAQEAYNLIAVELPEEAQYVVPMAYHIRWYYKLNLRALQWICELRSGAAGHTNYRYVAQEMANLVCQQFPLFEKFFRYVDYDGYDLGRLQQEQRKHQRNS